MVESLYQNVAVGEMKGWIRKELLYLLPSHFFQDPVRSAIALGGKCIQESKWRWAGFLELPEGKKIFLKRDLTKDWIESLKYMMFPSKGRKEWFIAYQMGKRHLNIPKPMGWLERIHRGLVTESYYLSEAVASKGSLPDLLRQEKIPGELVKAVLRMHNTGLFHQDLHAGNFLWDGESLFLVDLHRSRLIRSLSMRQRLWNIAQLFHSLRTVWGREDYETFLFQYFGGDSVFPKKKEEYLQRVYFDMDRLQKRQWKSRTKRCLKESTEFSVKEEKGATYYHRRDFPYDRLEKAREQHLSIAQETPHLLLKQSPEVLVSIFYEGESRICVKQYAYLQGWERLKERFRRSKGLKAWLGGYGLQVRGVSSIKLLGLMERKRCLGKVESLLFMEAPETGEEMDRFLCKGFHGSKEKRDLVAAFAGWLASLHQKGIYHQDMKACNILVSKMDHGWDFRLLDLEDVQLNQEINEKKLFNNLLQLNTSIPPLITLKDRLRFLREYLKRRPILKDKKNFLFRLIKKSRERGTVYVSPSGVVEEKLS